MTKKFKMLCGIFLLTILGIVGGISSAFAIDISFGDIEGNLDSIFSVGASFRVEDRDYNLIGKANQPEFYNDPTSYNVKDQLYQAQYGKGVVPSGLWSNNGDDGDLNFDTGLISELVKVTTDFSIKYMDFGFFARGMAFFDAYLMSESDDMRVDIMDNDDSKDSIGRGIDLLDAFVYYNSYLGDIPFSLRIGRQVINWGESAYIPHGISESNPIDVGKLRTPGGELKEAFIPVGSLWTSIGFTETINFESFYQYEFERMIPDAPGSYFSTNDFIGDGGNGIQSGFQYPDLKVYGIYGTPFNHVCERLEDHEASNNGQFGLKMSWFAEKLNYTEFGFYFVNYHSRRPVISGYVHDGFPSALKPRLTMLIDQGLYANDQLSQYIDAQKLAELSFGAKYMIATNQVNPNAVVGYFTGQLTQAQAFPQKAVKRAESNFFDPGEVYGKDSDFAGHARDGWIHGMTEFPEDIKLFGFSFNTVLPNGMSLAGEYSYRIDEPLQIDDVEMIMALSTPLYDILTLRKSTPLITHGDAYYSQIPNASGFNTAKPGDYIQGYQRFDISQAQISCTQLFSDVLGASKMSTLAEFGYVYVHDLPDQDVLRFDALGTVRSGNYAHAPSSSGIPGVDGFFNEHFDSNALGDDTTNHVYFYVPEGVEENDFASAFSWGYRLMAQLDYSNVFSGINVSPKFTFSHDVYGTTPVPIATFLKHRKSASLNINFDYQRKWSLDIGGRMYWGAGSANRMADRDYVWMTLKYAI
jgi:hypothetical protein